MRMTGAALAVALSVSGAEARDSGAFVVGDTGNEIELSRVQLYRAIGDRIVTGDDVIGNSIRNWNQIDPALPRAPIQVTLQDAGDEATLLDTVRWGCEEAGGSYRGCAGVGLRQGRLDRDGWRWQGAVLEQGMARFDAASMAMAAPSFPAPVEPAPTVVPPAPSIMELVTDNRADGSDSTISAVVSMDPNLSLEPVYATRMFLGRDSFPPEAFAAYGILAFNTLATSEDRAQYIAICEAFFSALLNSGDIAADRSEQMVTVWPIDDRTDPDLTDRLNTTRADENSCADAVEYYDIQIARGAIGDAKSAGIPLSGRGPFLLAWAPAAMKGRPDAIVLASDLSDVKSVADAKDLLTIWRDDIERDPALWQEGFSVEKLRVKLRQIVNRYGEGMMKFLGG